MSDERKPATMEASALIRPHIREMQAYQPVLPFEVRSQQLGLPAESIVKLDASENPYGPLPAVLEALGRLRYAHIYPDPESRDLRQALAAYHRLPVANLLVGAGADELIDLIVRLFLAPEDAVLICPPTFGMYAFDAEAVGARVISVQRGPDFALDVEAVDQAVRQHRPKLLFIASPNNPDGSLLPADALERLLELPVVIVLDEAYIEFAPPGSSQIRLAASPERENLIVLRTLSKWAGLAGLRVGYGVFPGSLMPHLWKIKQPYTVSVAASAAGLASLLCAGELEARGHRIVAERERLYAGLQAIRWLEPYPSQANFVLCRVLPQAGGDRVAASVQAALARGGILVRRFDQPGLRDCLRISVGRPEQTDALLRQLSEME